MEARHRAFLVELGCMQTRHTGRSLFEHLKNTHDLLRDWGNSDVICHAGLFHSIYGNDVFTHQSLNEREPLKKLIGDEAELLVHYFCTKQRPYFRNVTEPDRRQSLLEIEAANLLEQRSSRNVLRELAQMKISDRAKEALELELSW